jgi:predicted 2-oxoglutarate/Fe(II)-dependent dioxygenase YbiX
MRFDYFFYKCVYTPDECREIVEFANNNKTEHWVDNGAAGKKVKVTQIETSVIQDKLKRFFDFVHETNDVSFGFSLYPNLPRSLHLNTYSGQQNEYPFHKDGYPNGSASDLKLTAILNLSTEPYEGGEFHIFDGNISRLDQIDTTGSLLIFPSYTYHRVTPVTKGERITLGCWFAGPNWR